MPGNAAVRTRTYFVLASDMELFAAPSASLIQWRRRVGWSDATGPARLIPTRGALLYTPLARISGGNSSAPAGGPSPGVFCRADRRVVLDAAELDDAGLVLSRPCRAGAVVVEAGKAGDSVL